MKSRILFFVLSVLYCACGIIPIYAGINLTEHENKMYPLTIQATKTGTQLPGSYLQGGSPANLQGSQVSLQGSPVNLQGSSLNLQGSTLNPNEWSATQQSAQSTDNSADKLAAARATALAAQANPLLAALSALGGARDTATNRARSDYDSAISQYDDQFGIDKQRYQGQVTQNEQNLTGNRQAALLQAAQGGQGLRAVLAAMGALNGTGSVLADRAISQAANKDIGDAQNSFETNASTIQGAWADTEAQDKQRRSQANSVLEAALNSAETSFLNNRIDILGKLANVYGADTSQGLGYANQAASLYDQVAKIPQGQAVSYTPVSSLYSPQNLANYLAGTNNLQVQTQSGNSQPNSPGVVATVQKRKDELA